MGSPLLHIDIRGRAGTFDIDAQFESAAGTTALFGRSGAGKSTILAMLAGLLRPREGVIEVAGQTFFDSHAGINLPPEARHVGFVFQDARLFPHMSVAQNLTYAMGRLPRNRRKRTFARVVELLDVEALLPRRPSTLSGGEKQRVAIGRALLSNPRILLMDEPLANLDAARKSEILPYIEQLTSEFKIPVVYVSHALEEVVRLANTMVLVDKGCIKAQGTVEDLMGRLELSPLTGRYEAGAVLNATVAAHDTALALTRLSLIGHDLFTPRVDVAVGKGVRLRIRARDVALALIPPKNTSILNQLPAEVRDVVHGDGPHAEVALNITAKPGAPHAPPQILLARITRKSMIDLKLHPQQKIHALIKAVAIDRHSLGGLGSGA